MYGSVHETMLHGWQETTAPAGWRAEIVGEQILLAPPRDPDRASIAAGIRHHLRGFTGHDRDVFWCRGLSVPSGDLYVPEVSVSSTHRLAGHLADLWVDAALMLLVVEIPEAGQAEICRSTKRHGYASAGVPLHLLIDRFDEDGPAVTLFSDPVDGHYQHVIRIPFGEKISLPEPFAVDLDTGGF
jgi:hypothetical protein